MVLTKNQSYYMNVKVITTRNFFIVIACLTSMLIAANLARYAENTPQEEEQNQGQKNNLEQGQSASLHTRYIVGSDRHGNTLLKEYPATPPVRELFPNWLAADSMFERGTPEWERTALHPVLLIDEWELELRARLADEP